MAQPANRSKELNLNKPNTFYGDWEKFRKFLQDIKVYMDVNHKVYNTNLRKIAFVLLLMNAGAADIWKAQYIDKANAWPTPADQNNKLEAYTTFRKELIKAFSMFNSVRDALDKLQALKIKKNDSIDEHMTKFKMLAAKSEIDTMNPLTIKLFKETLPWGLTLQLMKLETPLKTINDWNTWAVMLDHRHHKLTQATKQTRWKTKPQTEDTTFYKGKETWMQWM
jgi:Domain of unknown function (DUF4939)